MPAELPDDIARRAQAYRAHPGFRRIISTYCNTVSRASAGQWPLSKLFDQFTRYLTCYILIHNYYAWRQGGGPLPTLSLLQPAVEASPRQTAGFITSLKAGRLVLVESAPGDRRNKLLRPGVDMIMEIGRSAQAFVAAAEALEGGQGLADRLAEDPDALGTLIYHSAAHVLAHGTLIHPFPRILSFARRDCGYLLLCTVMGAHYEALAGGEGLPLLSYRALAERLQVSAAHVGNLLGEAERNGWFAVGARGRLASIDDSLVDEFELWAACQMTHFIERARDGVPAPDVRTAPVS